MCVCVCKLIFVDVYALCKLGEDTRCVNASCVCIYTSCVSHFVVVVVIVSSYYGQAKGKGENAYE